jgi:hypothetical protein
MNDLEAYLQNPTSYELAVSLFEKYGNNAHLLRTAKIRKNENLHQTLNFELKLSFKRLGGVPKANEIKLIIPSLIQKIEEKPTLQAQNKTLEGVAREQQHLYNLMAKTSNMLVNMSTENPKDSQAKELVAEILAAKEKYNQLAEAKKHYFKTGELPVYNEEKPANSYDSLPKDELLKKQKLLRSQISKARSNLSAHRNNEAKIGKYNKKLQELQKEILIVENLLCKS